MQVLNGSGVQGAANQRSNDLKAKGYQVLPAGNAPHRAPARPCSARRATRRKPPRSSPCSRPLSIKATVEPYPNPAPVGPSDQANCLIILGK